MALREKLVVWQENIGSAESQDLAKRTQPAEESLKRLDMVVPNAEYLHSEADRLYEQAVEAAENPKLAKGKSYPKRPYC